MRVSKNVRVRKQLRQRKQAATQKQVSKQPHKADQQKAELQQCSRVADNEQWVEQNFSDCQFGHVLRTRRLMIMATNILECPNESLPKQNVDWSDVKAAYRFFNRKEVTFNAVTQCHQHATRQTPPGVYLMISDTTEIDHSTHEATEGLGMLGDGRGRGMHLHSCLVVDATTDIVRGVAAAKVFYRKAVPSKETRMQRLARSRESTLWGDVTQQAGRPPEGSQWIHVWDRGGDNFEAMCHIVKTGCDWLIRASKLNRVVQLESGDLTTLEDAVSCASPVGSYELHLRTRPGVPARVASVRVGSTRVTLPQPKMKSPFVKSCGIWEITTNILVIEEVNAPKGVTPIRWIIQTSLPINTITAAWTVIEYYESRWLIEEYHKVMKSGCSIERHSLRTADRLEPLIGLISVVGVRLLSLKTVSRHEPEAKAKHRVPGLWLTALQLMKPKLAKKELTVYEFFREVAKLGGFLARKHDGEPGWQSIWTGYKKLHGRIEGMKLLMPRR